MKLKNTLLSALLIAAITLSACGASDPEVPDNTDSTPVEDTTAPIDPFESIRDSGEEWLTYGLSAYENEKPSTDLKEFFSNPSKLTYLTLYDHFFTYDKTNSVPVAEELFRFIYEEYGVDALLDMDKRVEYKNAYLKSLGLDIIYPQTPEVEAFLASMDFSSNSTYQYIFAFDNITYYFEDFGAGAPSQYHGFLYNTTTGLFDMIEYLKANDLDAKLDTDRNFNFYMTFDGSGYSRTMYDTGDMYINDSVSVLHEAVHAMGIQNSGHIWLSEGICSYFGKALGFNDQIAATYIQMLMMTRQGYFDERADAGEQGAMMYKMLYEQYTAAGGKLEHVDVFDLRLYSDIIAKLEYDTFKNTTLGEAYQLVNKKECTSIGSELTYEQATSLVVYLADIYGIDKVLEAYHTQDIEGVFGKDYEGLKADWLQYLG